VEQRPDGIGVLRLELLDDMPAVARGPASRHRAPLSVKRDLPVTVALEYHCGPRAWHQRCWGSPLDNRCIMACGAEPNGIAGTGVS
jgi:hypothetical protein